MTMADIRNYHCPNCNASLKFNPTGQTWHCEYCFADFNKQELDSVHQSAKDTVKSEANTKRTTGTSTSDKEMMTYHCKNCGAKIVADPSTVATFCLYCKSPTIIEDKLKHNFAPDYIIPFQIDQKKAKELYGKWIKGKIFAPKGFKQDEEIDKIRGIYAPFWLFSSSKVQGFIRGTGEKKKRWTIGEIEYIETSRFQLERQGETSYNHLPFDSSTKLDDTLMSNIAPFDYKLMRPFSMDYMSGFFAERYDVEDDTLVEKAEQKMKEGMRSNLMSTLGGYQNINIEQAHFEVHDLESNYGMLPVYLMTNEYEGKLYQYAVNGQTGLIYGEVPTSKAKVAGFGLTATVIFWVVLVIGGALLGYL